MHVDTDKHHHEENIKVSIDSDFLRLNMYFIIF